MRVFIFFDEEFPAYPILGIYSTLERAQAAAAENDCVSPRFCIYEETLDEAGEVTEPVYHRIPDSDGVLGRVKKDEA